MTSPSKVVPAFTAAVFGLLVPAAVSAQRYFPLDPGNTWTYSSDIFGGTAVNSVLEVDETGVARFARRGDFEILRLVESGDDVDIELPEEDLVPFYRFGEDRFTHRDTFTCTDGTVVTVGSRQDTVKTPAGVFEGCIRLEYGLGPCSDAGLEVEWFAPDVGLVRWAEQNIVGSVTWTLVSFESSGAIPFTRGDVNDSGGEEIADAIYALRWLNLAGPEPGCLKSADVNDDGKVNISDPIALLAFLFLGGFPPHAPFPECGFDRTPGDDLTCASFRGCRR
jgi:hypothetical protein